MAAVATIGAVLVTSWPAAALGIMVVIAGAGISGWVLCDHHRTRRLVSLILAVRGNGSVREVTHRPERAVCSLPDYAPPRDLVLVARVARHEPDHACDRLAFYRLTAEGQQHPRDAWEEP